VCLAAASLAASASPAAASVTIGQLAPDPASVTCASTFDRTQLTVTSGNTYVVPGAGTITSWSHNARAGAGQTLTMKVFRKVADPARYMVVGHDDRPNLTEGVVNTFPASIPVKPGDVIGLNNPTPGPVTACLFSAPGSILFRSASLADGEQGDFTTSALDRRVNVSAVFVPSNAFTLGKVKRNEKKGTATLTATVPNPGELTGSGKGVKVASAAVISKTVSAPGEVKLKIRAKGKKKATLNETGKVKVKPKITYTPTGGDPATQSRKLKLKKR
jgi:hypothetical protein